MDKRLHIFNKLFLLFLILGLLTLIKVSWASDNLPYSGPIYNVFFHPLIVDPELAFKKSRHLAYMDNWFITIDEFKKILPQLYKRGFVLVSPKDLFSEKRDANGQWIFSRKKLFLPEGKKPLILSLDDYNFYKTMKNHGTIQRFEVDKQNNLVTIITTQKNTLIPDDQEIPQLLETFINKHPDFSYHNARGIISLTGYNGIFGFNTQNRHNDDISSAKKVANKLKQMGWEFASHSYFHVAESKQTEVAFEKSEIRWIKEVGSIVGHTAYYIFPFGDDWHTNKLRMDFLSSLGYKYFFEVSQSNSLIIKPNAVIMQRFPIDGGAMRGKYKNSKNYFDVVNILDPSRLMET